MKTEIVFNGRLYKLGQSYDEIGGGQLSLYFDLTVEQCEQMKLTIGEDQDLLIRVTEAES